ncbi:MAG: response regulator [Planctomycetota bacterium]|jgi:DNA-binding NtrC family response regulator
MSLLPKIQNILICDHEESFRYKLRDVLESKGFSVQEASKASEAVKYVLKQKFEAVVFCTESEDMECMQILSAIIRGIDYKLPFIVVIGSNVPLSSVSSIIHESFRLFQKPVDCNEIEEAIREAIMINANIK